MNNSIGNFGRPQPLPQTGFGRIGQQRNHDHGGHERTERFQRRHNKGPAFQEAQMRRHDIPQTGGDDVAGPPELTDTEKQMLYNVIVEGMRGKNAARERMEGAKPKIDAASISSDGMDALAGDGQGAGGGKIGPGSNSGGPSGGAGLQSADPSLVPPTNDGGFQVADPSLATPTDDGDGDVDFKGPSERPDNDAAPKRPSFTARKA